MASTRFKRSESIVYGVRRLAVQRLDVLLELLHGPTLSDPARAKARQEAAAFNALLQLVRTPLGAEVYRREQRWLKRLRRMLDAPAIASRKPAKSPRSATTRHDDPGRWRDLARRGGLEGKALDLVVAAAAAASEPADKQEDAAGQVPQGARAEAAADADAPVAAKGPDPALLRRRADLAEARMRARYWHLPTLEPGGDGEFKLLSPGLRRPYQRARKLAADCDADHDDGAPATAALAEALDTLSLQLRLIEKAWPDLLQPLRKAADDAADHAHQRAALAQLQHVLPDHADASTAVDTAAQARQAALDSILDRLLTESAPALSKRVEAYWNAWRRDGSG